MGSLFRSSLVLLVALVARPAVAGRGAGERVSLDLVEADMRDVLRYFSAVSGMNLVVDPGVRGQVTVKLVDVAWEDALSVIARTHGLGYEFEDNVLYVAPVDVLLRRSEAEAELERSKLASAKLGTVIIAISYADPHEVARILEATVLTRRGSVVVDARTSRIIVTDVESNLPRAGRTVRRLDR